MPDVSVFPFCFYQSSALMFSTNLLFSSMRCLNWQLRGTNKCTVVLTQRAVILARFFFMICPFFRFYKILAWKYGDHVEVRRNADSRWLVGAALAYFLKGPSVGSYNKNSWLIIRWIISWRWRHYIITNRFSIFPLNFDSTLLHPFLKSNWVNWSTTH